MIGFDTVCGADGVRDKKREKGNFTKGNFTRLSSDSLV